MSLILDGTSGVTTNSGTLVATTDATISGLTVGKGGGSVAHNVVVGATTIPVGATGDYNNAFGWNTLHALTSGATNNAFGNAALYANTTGSNNIAIGETALFSNTTASNITAVGYQAGYSNTTGYELAFFGYQAGYANTTGYSNTFLGHGAGSSITTGYQNIYIGRASTASSATVFSEIVIGFSTTGKGNSTGFINPNSGGVYQGNNSANWSTTSDQRLKKNIADNNDGLNKINAIRVRNFEYRLPEEVTELEAHCAIEKSGVQLGVIAQELQAVLPECVKTESTGVMSVDSDNLTWYLINAVKEQQALIIDLTTRLTALEAK